MRQPSTNICPLLAIAGIGGNNGPTVCLEDCCAWWDHLAGSCCIAAGADALQGIAASLEELTSNYQAPGNLPMEDARHGKEA